METKNVMMGSILIGMLAFTGLNQASAQEVQRPAADSADARVATVQAQDYDRDDGFDWGLLGLLGLLGLIPRKREVLVHRDDANRHSTTGPNRT